jgi:hypothetical protein
LIGRLIRVDSGLKFSAVCLSVKIALTVKDLTQPTNKSISFLPSFFLDAKGEQQQHQEATTERGCREKEKRTSKSWERRTS